MLCGVEQLVENVQQRAEGWERGRPITIGANCWLDPGPYSSVAHPRLDSALQVCIFGSVFLGFQAVDYRWCGLVS